MDTALAAGARSPYSRNGANVAARATATAPLLLPGCGRQWRRQVAGRLGGASLAASAALMSMSSALRSSEWELMIAVRAPE